MTTYVHQFNRSDRLYQVGYHDQLTKQWHCLEEFSSIAEAAAFINYLNGGDGKRFEYGE